MIDPKNNWTSPSGCEKDYCDTMVAAQLRTSVDHVQKMKMHLNGMTSIEQLSEITMQPNRKVVVEAAIGGDLVKP